MYKNAILGLVAQTAIHAGASSSEAAIDLPIQRETHTDWPVVFGSGMKGALRGHFEGKLDPATLFAVFGPDTANAADHAGALLVSDARLVLLPVRSMTSHVKWVSCPALLNRLSRDLKRMQIAHDDWSLEGVSSTTALTSNHADDLYLEEFRFSTKVADLTTLLATLVKLTGEQLAQELKQNLVIVSDDQFRHLCRHATPVQAHIAIDNKTKTVKPGALWYEENLPAETVMYCCLSCTDGRDAQRQSATQLLSALQKPLAEHNFLQVGGNLTTGMGWFETQWNQGATNV
ncbi:type III-B CRISPR module RAMP protein Cmr4 [Rheinheimera sp.]|uniref:type III-B CRISPR module RAMP protein Cmr4 n=1 Tax=Rheinheimera sp. TaxID=1869214 RepID=UPI003AF9E9AE